MEAGEKQEADTSSSRAKLNSRRKKKKDEGGEDGETHLTPTLRAEAAEFVPPQAAGGSESSDSKIGTTKKVKVKSVSKKIKMLTSSKATKKDKDKDKDKTADATNSSSLTAEKGTIAKKERLKVDSQLEQTVHSPIEFECAICASVDTKHISFGRCSHAICSLCAMRIRYKGRDYSCTICKQDMDVMLTCSLDFGSSLSERPTTKKQQPKLLKRGEKVDGQATKKDASRQTGAPQAPIAPPTPTWESVSVAMGMEVGDAIDETYPGVESDPASRIMYVRCDDHFREHQAMRSAACYVKGCKESFRSEAKLLRHLEERHGQWLCQICVENRPLFLCEHKVMKSKKEVQKHVVEDPTKPGADKLGGHPECRFCKKHFFDASALYNHMVSQHHNCPLCPVQHQFRFYQTTRQLEVHIREEHLVCESCFDLRAGRLVAFTRHAEYEEHMQRVHHVRNVSLQSLLASSVSSGSGSQSQRQQKRGRGGQGQEQGRGQEQGQEYIELDMNSRDPNQVSTTALLQREIREANRALASSGGLGLDIGSGDGVAAIPANMQIAGQIVGGRLSRNVPGAEALQEASSAAYRQFTSSVRRQNSSLALESTSEAFPSLPTASVGGGGGGGGSSGGPGPRLHAMSLVNKQRERNALRMEKERQEQLQKREREEARLARSRRLAQSFGVLSGLSFLPAPSLDSDSGGGGGGGHEGSSESLIERHAALLRPLYTDGLLSWVRNNKHDVLRIEKKLRDLIDSESPATASTQLKPMPVGQRMASHQLARYYGCHSYEYDHEPRRYVSIVRTANSAVPGLLLSHACELSAFPIYPGLRERRQPELYFGLLNGFYPKLGVNLELGSNEQSLSVLTREDQRDNTLLAPSSASSVSSSVVLGVSEEPSVALNRVWINEAGVSASQLCGYLASVTKDNKGSTPLQCLRAVQPRGANSVILTFSSVDAAWACASRVYAHYRVHKDRLKELAAARRVPPTGRAHLLDLFEMELGFPEPEHAPEPEPEPEPELKMPGEEVQSVAAQMQARERQRARLESAVQADWAAWSDHNSDSDIDIGADNTDDAKEGASGEESGCGGVFTARDLPWPLPRQAQRHNIDPYTEPDLGAAGVSIAHNKEVEILKDDRFDFAKMRAKSGGERRPLQLQPRADAPPLPPAPAPAAAAGGGRGISLYRPPRPSSSPSSFATAAAPAGKAVVSQARRGSSREDETPPTTERSNLYDVLNSSEDSEDTNDGETHSHDDDGGGESLGEERGADEATEQWACALCTFLNSPLLQECEMCGSPAM